MLYAATAYPADQNEPSETTDRSPHRLISAVDLRELLGGVTDMTISRWLKNDKLDFPKPIRIVTRRYWYEAEVIKWIGDRPRERRCAESDRLIDRSGGGAELVQKGAKTGSTHASNYTSEREGTLN